MANFRLNTDSTITTPLIKYPQNLGQPPFDKWIKFSARAGRHILRNQIAPEQASGIDRVIQSVGLYLSETALKSTLEVAWDNVDLQPFVGAAVEFFAQTGQNILDSKPNSQGFFSSLFGGLKELTGRFSGGASVGDLEETVKQAIKTDMVKGLNYLTEGGGSVISGSKPNPRTDLLFDTQKYRTHQFDFLLVPRNLQEAQNIDRIIHFFQFYMLPSYQASKLENQAKVGAFLIGFPYEFTIDIAASDPNGFTARPIEHVNKIGRSVLTQVSIDHAAGGKTAFVKENGEYYPVATRLNLTFQEVRLLGRDSDEISRDGITEEDPRAV